MEKEHIPKIIWTYWNDVEIPSNVMKCINTWKIFCKENWNIIILNQYTIHNWLEENVDFPKSIFNELPCHQSDLFGTALLYKYGGIWLDASIIITKSLNWILEYKNWFCYYENNQFEIFLYASSKQGYVISKIYKTLKLIFDLDTTNRTNYLINNFNIQDNYLFPQKLVDIIIKKDDILGNIINNNSLPQWTTSYLLVMYLHHRYNCTSKNQVISTLNNITDPLPEELLLQPIHKLQGAGTLFLNEQINYKSWWFILTNTIKCS